MQVLECFDTLCIQKTDRTLCGFDWAAFLDPARILDAAKEMKNADYHLESIHALDGAEGMLLNYFFDRYEQHERLCLRVLLSHEELIVDSLAHIFQGAEWHERETYDFHGILFTNNPNMVNLLLPAESELHPLVKAEKKRQPFKTLLAAGEIVSKSDGFILLDEDTGEEQ